MIDDDNPAGVCVRCGEDLWPIVGAWEDRQGDAHCAAWPRADHELEGGDDGR